MFSMNNKIAVYRLIITFGLLLGVTMASRPKLKTKHLLISATRVNCSKNKNKHELMHIFGMRPPSRDR